MDIEIEERNILERKKSIELMKIYLQTNNPFSIDRICFVSYGLCSSFVKNKLHYYRFVLQQKQFSQADAFVSLALFFLLDFLRLEYQLTFAFNWLTIFVKEWRWWG